MLSVANSLLEGKEEHYSQCKYCCHEVAEPGAGGRTQPCLLSMLFLSGMQGWCSAHDQEMKCWGWSGPVRSSRQTAPVQTGKSRPRRLGGETPELAWWTAWRLMSVSESDVPWRLSEGRHQSSLAQWVIYRAKCRVFE